MKLEYLKHHTYLIPEIAELKFHHYRFMAPEKTLKDFHHNLERDLNDKELPIGYVIVENCSFVGAVSLRICDLNSHQHLTPWLGGVFVHPSKRNQGIGAFLVRQAEKIAAKRGYERLYLYTHEKASWYAKLGWTAYESVFLKEVPIAIMEKQLVTSQHTS
jgi:GNAT superfamily N-acetyltransferase